jgi:hypothetical protein
VEFKSLPLDLSFLCKSHYALSRFNQKLIEERRGEHKVGKGISHAHKTNRCRKLGPLGAGSSVYEFKQGQNLAIARVEGEGVCTVGLLSYVYRRRCRCRGRRGGDGRKWYIPSLHILGDQTL